MTYAIVTDHGCYHLGYRDIRSRILYLFMLSKSISKNFSFSKSKDMSDIGGAGSRPARVRPRGLSATAAVMSCGFHTHTLPEKVIQTSCYTNYSFRQIWSTNCLGLGDGYACHSPGHTARAGESGATTALAAATKADGKEYLRARARDADSAPRPAWSRTNGVNSNGAAAKVMDLDRLGKNTWHFWEYKSRLTVVITLEVPLSKKTKNCSDPINADPICPFLNCARVDGARSGQRSAQRATCRERDLPVLSSTRCMARRS